LIHFYKRKITKLKNFREKLGVKIRDK